MYTINVTFTDVRPTPDQQLIFTQAFRDAFRLKSFPPVTESGIHGQIGDHDLTEADILDIPSYLTCSHFPATGTITKPDGKTVPGSNYGSQDLGDNTWYRFREVCQEYELHESNGGASMKTYRMVSDLKFQAKDIDDAFDKLSKHFRRLRNGEDSDLIIEGEINLKKVE